jgi:NitT/TauT family transport system substrate-binding protein
VTLPPAIWSVKVGTLGSWSFFPVYVGADKGFFAEQGIKVEFQEFRTGSSMIAFLSTGELDLGGGETGTALFNAIGQGLGVRAIASLSSEPKGYGAGPLLVRKDLFESGQVTKPADLKGRRIAINATRGIVEYVLSEALAKGGLTVDDVQLVTLPFADTTVALANKAVDAAVLPYPFAAKTLEEDGSAVILLAGDTPQIAVLYFGRRLLDPANRELGVRFLVGYLKAARDLYGDGWRSEENIAILSKYSKVSPAAIRKSIPYFCDPNGQINKASVERTQNYFMQRGYLELSQPLALSQVIEETFLTEAVERLGRFEPAKVPGENASEN